MTDTEKIKQELKLLKGDIKLCNITTEERLNPFDRASKEKPKEHLLEHIKHIEDALTEEKETENE